MNKIEHKKRSYKQNLSVGLLLHPPKSDDIYAQLTRGTLITNDFLRNLHFKKPKKSQDQIISKWKTSRLEVS